jgi:hypothetical protein
MASSVHEWALMTCDFSSPSYRPCRGIEWVCARGSIGPQKSVPARCTFSLSKKLLPPLWNEWELTICIWTDRWKLSCGLRVSPSLKDVGIRPPRCWSCRMKMSPLICSFHSSAICLGRTPPVWNDSQSLFQACPEPMLGCVEMIGHLAVASGVDRKRGLARCGM